MVVLCTATMCTRFHSASSTAKFESPTHITALTKCTSPYQSVASSSHNLLSCQCLPNVSICLVVLSLLTPPPGTQPSPCAAPSCEGPWPAQSQTVGHAPCAEWRTVCTWWCNLLVAPLVSLMGQVSAHVQRYPLPLHNKTVWLCWTNALCTEGLSSMPGFLREMAGNSAFIIRRVYLYQATLPFPPWVRIGSQTHTLQTKCLSRRCKSSWTSSICMPNLLN